MVSLATNFRRSVIIAELWRPEVARPGNFLSNFFKKRPLMVKFSKFGCESFHRLIDRRCFVEMLYKFSDGKSAKSCVISQTKNNFGSPSNCRDRAQNLPEPAPNIRVTLFLNSSKSIHLRRSYIRMREGCSFASQSIFMIGCSSL